MASADWEWAPYRLPDGSVRRSSQRDAAAALAAAELLLAAATKSSDALTAARLSASQRATAQDLEDHYQAAELAASVRAEAEAEVARQGLAKAEVVAQERAAAQALALQEIAEAELLAVTALTDFEAKASTTTDLAAYHRLAADELSAARLRAASTLAAARESADARLAAEARRSANERALAVTLARAAQAKELAAAHATAAEELAAAHATAAEELVAAHATAAEELVAAASAAAEALATSFDEAAREVALAETQFRLVMDWAAVAACTVSPEGHFLRVNRALCDLLGRSEDELLGQRLEDVTHPDDAGLLAAMMGELMAGHRGSFRTLSRYLASDGRVVWGDLSIAAVVNSDGTAAFHIAQIVDVTERMDYEAALATMATHDTLTGLANRPAMMDEITRALNAQHRAGHSTAVLALDLDHFKNVNDSLGHAAGDEVLRAAAARIESVMRGGDLAARPGGDEFIVVMRDLADAADALQAAWRLVGAFRLPFLASGREFYATASIGIAIATGSAPDVADVSGQPTVNAGDLLREADTAMYAAKAEGRDRVSIYNEELRAIVSARVAVEADLRQASVRGELAVWYQPEIDLTSGEVIAVEALLRWHHPDGSVWSADRFIDVAEDTGIILDIGAWALGQACTQAAAWAAARPDRPIIMRVNQSALQIGEQGLLPNLDDALAASGLDPALLCIEITETAMLRQTSTASANLAGIHRRGIAIAIDDFGTGYASLVYLRRYPVSVIKIDSSFVTDIATNHSDRAIVTAILGLATAMGMTVTAEGIERPDQAACLRLLGCPGAQGWLYSKALPADEATRALDRIYAPV